MNADIKRILLASVLIFAIVYFQPLYLKWLVGDSPQQPIPVFVDKTDVKSPLPKTDDDIIINQNIQKVESSQDYYTIYTDLFTATISNRGGGTINKLILLEKNSSGYKYFGTYLSDGEYYPDELVELAPITNNSCTPCLADFNTENQEYFYFNQPFYLKTALMSDVVLSGNQNKTLTFRYDDPKGFSIEKSVTFYGNTYQTDHDYVIINKEKFYPENLELIWSGGLRPTEIYEMDDVTYASAVAGQAGETEEINQTNKDDNIKRVVFHGNTDWVSVRSKYFSVALISDVPGRYATLSSKNIDFSTRSITPEYQASIAFNVSEVINTKLYFGPLDIDHISKTNTYLDNSMNFGFWLIRPIGKLVLWLLKFMHNTLRLNYGLALILFAFMVRIITGPLTKKSFESSQKMQKIQPKVKAIQKKLKAEPQKMNKEVMALYKKHGVNPLGGCLPLLLQMPLLWALFVVFRSTIEFRGANFIFWINDLSRPDVIINLPFNIPLYGAHIAVLPILMGISIFLTQRMSMATMDKSQRPMMYIMNGFFILIFNSFPSGLNLYYTVYNILNYFQQRSIRNAGLT